MNCCLFNPVSSLVACCRVPRCSCCLLCGVCVPVPCYRGLFCLVFLNGVVHIVFVHLVFVVFFVLVLCLCGGWWVSLSLMLALWRCLFRRI